MAAIKHSTSTFRVVSNHFVVINCKNRGGDNIKLGLDVIQRCHSSFAARHFVSPRYGVLWGGFGE